ncbi:MAG TPA: hypothetical protein VGG33_01260 [Polyangia bacterium]
MFKPVSVSVPASLSPAGIALALGVFCLGLSPPTRASQTDSTAVVSPARSASAPQDAGVVTEASSAFQVPASSPRTSPLRIGLATAAALVPGVLVHGSGAFVLGDANTGLRLLAWEGTGLGMFLAGGLGLVLTGASRKTVVPFSLLTMSGLGLFSLTWLADIYSALSPTFRPGLPTLDLPLWEVELGYLGVAGGPFPVGNVGTFGLTTRPGAWRFHTGAEIAVDADNRRFGAGLVRRFFGPLAHGPGAGDDSYLEGEVRSTVHSFGDEGFHQGTGDLLVRGRRALARTTPRLAGAFAEMAVGIGLESYHFADSTDLNTRLLGEVAFGVNLGRGGPVRGEAMAFYDHRKDGFVGGLPLFGIAGHAGARARIHWGPRWGLAAEVAAGRSTASRLAIIYTGDRS